MTTSVPGTSIRVKCIKLHVAIMPIFRTEQFAPSLILIGRNFFFTICLELTYMHTDMTANITYRIALCLQTVYRMQCHECTKGKLAVGHTGPIRMTLWRWLWTTLEVEPVRFVQQVKVMEFQWGLCQIMSGGFVAKRAVAVSWFFRQRKKKLSSITS